MNQNLGRLIMISGAMSIFMGFAADTTIAIIGGIAAIIFGNQLKKQQAHNTTSLNAPIMSAPPKFELTDDMIIRLARNLKGGRLSVRDLTEQTSLDATEAQQRLEDLAAKGICQINLNEIESSGVIYYQFD